MTALASATREAEAGERPPRQGRPHICGGGHYSAALRMRVPFAQRLGIARGDVGVGGIGADARQDLPRARAFPALGEPHLDRDPAHVVEPEGVGRTIAFHQGRRRRDRDLGQVDIDQRGEQIGVGDIDHRRRLERGADALSRPLDLERAGDHAADVAHLAPLLGQRLVAPGRRHLREQLQMHGAVGARMAREPRLLGGERQHRARARSRWRGTAGRARSGTPCGSARRSDRSRARPCGCRNRTPTGRTS